MVEIALNKDEGMMLISDDAMWASQEYEYLDVCVLPPKELALVMKRTMAYFGGRA